MWGKGERGAIIKPKEVQCARGMVHDETTATLPSHHDTDSTEIKVEILKLEV